MRDISAALKARFAREDLSICRCVILKLKGGTVYYLTDLNRPITVNGLIFKPEPNIDVSAVRTGKDTASQNAEINLTYEETGLAERPIRFGLINDALCEVYWVDYRKPELGGALMIAGKISSVEQPRKSYCVLKLTAVSTAGNSLLVAEVYSKRCRNVFGDKRCKVNVDALSVPFTVVQTFPDAAQFAINGYADFLPPDDDDYVRPTENGTYKQYEKGEFDFDVPNAQILKLRLASSGGGGATSGGGSYVYNNRKTVRAGHAGNTAFPMVVTRTTRGNQELFRLLGGQGGNPFPGYDSRVNGPNNNPFVLYEKPAKASNGSLVPGLLVADYKPAGALGGKGSASGGSLNSDEGQGGDAGDGGLIEYVFNLQDAACPIKEGDRIHFSNGSAGDSPDFGPMPDPVTETEAWRSWTSPGTTGKQGFFEMEWQSNVGEPILEKTFNLGSVLWTKGNNAGQINQIAANTVGLITLAMNPRLPIDVGDEGMFRPGCSNFADMCEDRWNNLINMQAEPVTPQGVTTAPSPIADTSTDLTKPAPVTQLEDYGFSGTVRGAG